MEKPPKTWRQARVRAEALHYLSCSGCMCDCVCCACIHVYVSRCGGGMCASRVHLLQWSRVKELKCSIFTHCHSHRARIINTQTQSMHKRTLSRSMTQFQVLETILEERTSRIWDLSGHVPQMKSYYHRIYPSALIMAALPWEQNFQWYRMEREEDIEALQTVIGLMSPHFKLIKDRSQTGSLVGALLWESSQNGTQPHTVCRSGYGVIFFYTITFQYLAYDIDTCTYLY